MADVRDTGTGLKKLIAGLSLAALTLGALLYGVHNNFLSGSGVIYILGIIVALLMFLFYNNSKFLYAIYIGLVTAIFIFSSNSILEALFFLSSAALPGIIVYAMILGHWYLVTPRLSNLPLLRAFTLMGGLLLVKLGFAGYSFFSGSLVVDSFGQILIAMRILWGYLVVVGMGYFGYRLAEMNSFQSATGILYAMTFAVFIGELGSHYLYYQYGIWL